MEKRLLKLNSLFKLDKDRFLFAHRCNADKTCESICPRCFCTVAQSACEPDIHNAEASHVCNPAMVEYYRVLSKAVSDYRVESRAHCAKESLGRCGAETVKVATADSTQDDLQSVQ